MYSRMYTDVHKFSQTGCKSYVYMLGWKLSLVMRQCNSKQDCPSAMLISLHSTLPPIPDPAWESLFNLPNLNPFMVPNLLSWCQILNTRLNTFVFFSALKWSSENLSCSVTLLREVSKS